MGMRRREEFPTLRTAEYYVAVTGRAALCSGSVRPCTQVANRCTVMVMRGRRLLVPLLLFSLSTFRALACASSPDPLWVPGVYDDADYDDVILTIGSLDARWLF